MPRGVHSPSGCTGRKGCMCSRGCRLTFCQHRSPEHPLLRILKKPNIIGILRWDRTFDSCEGKKNYSVHPIGPAGSEKDGRERHQGSIAAFYQVEIPSVIYFNPPCPLKGKYPFCKVMPQPEVLQMPKLLSFNTPRTGSPLSQLLGIFYGQGPRPGDKAND